MDYKSSKVRISHCQVVISEQEYNELQREKRNSERLLFYMEIVIKWKGKLLNINETLKHYFGYDSLRPGQQELIEGILQRKDVLGIMPTGAGKSLCYQVPALMLDGITIVVSPLISLMTDQVKALNQAGVHAAYINSSLTDNQIRTALFMRHRKI